MIQAVWKNRELFDSYQQEISTAPPLEDRDGVKKFKIPFFLYHGAEERVVESELLYPVIEMTYTCEISYTSPQGRNSYVDAKVFSFDKLESEYKLYLIRQQKKKEYEESKEYQRRRMTKALRYDIMKRDGFRCVLCGRSAKDGIELQVDHILPVAKGGKSVPENLRTLCADCNLGKSDRYDADSEN